jgi:hypothetical protein
MSPGATVECQTILFEEIAMVGVEDARRVAFRRGHRAGVVEQLAEFLDRVADVGAQHVFAEELVEHLADRRLQEGHAARVAGAVPRVGAVVGVVHQRAEERRRQAVQVGLGFADDVTGDEFRRVLEHVDEAVQFAQDIVGDMARGAGFAVQVDRDVGVLVADLFDEGAQRLQSGVGFLDRAGAEFLIVDRQHEGRRARLLLGELGQVAIAGHAQHFHAFFFHRIGQGAYAQAGRVLGTEILVDDDDGETKFHACLQKSKPPLTVCRGGQGATRSRAAKNKNGILAEIEALREKNYPNRMHDRHDARITRHAI